MATTEGGRKYALARLFLGLSTLEFAAAVAMGVVLPDGLLNMQGAVVMAFIAGNAAVSYAYSETTTKSDATTRTIQERRDAESGTEPTP
jgi:hypothetical protein